MKFYIIISIIINISLTSNNRILIEDSISCQNYGYYSTLVDNMRRNSPTYTKESSGMEPKYLITNDSNFDDADLRIRNFPLTMNEQETTIDNQYYEKEHCQVSFSANSRFNNILYNAEIPDTAPEYYHETTNEPSSYSILKSIFEPISDNISQVQHNKCLDMEYQDNANIMSVEENYIQDGLIKNQQVSMQIESLNNDSFAITSFDKNEHVDCVTKNSPCQLIPDINDELHGLIHRDKFESNNDHNLNNEAVINKKQMDNKNNFMTQNKLDHESYGINHTCDIAYPVVRTVASDELLKSNFSNSYVDLLDINDGILSLSYQYYAKREPTLSQNSTHVKLKVICEEYHKNVRLSSEEKKQKILAYLYCRHISRYANMSIALFIKSLIYFSDAKIIRFDIETMIPTVLYFLKYFDIILEKSPSNRLYANDVFQSLLYIIYPFNNYAISIQSESNKCFFKACIELLSCFYIFIKKICKLDQNEIDYNVALMIEEYKDPLKDDISDLNGALKINENTNIKWIDWKIVHKGFYAHLIELKPYFMQNYVFSSRNFELRLVYIKEYLLYRIIHIVTDYKFQDIFINENFNSIDCIRVDIFDINKLLTLFLCHSKIVFVFKAVKLFKFISLHIMKDVNTTLRNINKYSKTHVKEKLPCLVKRQNKKTEECMTKLNTYNHIMVVSLRYFSNYIETFISYQNSCDKITNLED